MASTGHRVMPQSAASGYLNPVPEGHTPHMAPRVTGPALIGREPELAALVAALDRADAGAATIAIVAGDAGIGKTRLVDALAEHARARGSRVMTGGCLDLADDGLPYAPIIEGLRGLARDLSKAELRAMLGPAADDLRRLLPGLGPIAGSAPSNSDAEASSLDQARLYDLVLGLFGSLATDAPSLVVIEDLHWVDRATQDLVRFLARNLDEERVLIVLTVRSDGLDRGDPVAAWLASLERDPATVRLDLAPLDRDGVARQLVTGLETPPSEDLIERIYRRSGGNPYFVEELLKRERAGGTGPLPRTLTETLTAQVAALPDSSQSILGIVAVGGRAVDERLVAAVADLPEQVVREPIRTAIDRGVLVLDPGGGSLRPRHALLAEVIEASLLPAERRALHERYATVLTDRPDLADPSPTGATGELAHHWFAADRPQQAFRASLEAATAAEAVYAYRSALRQYERAIDLEPRIQRADGDPDAVELRRAAARTADDAGESERAIEWFQDALRRVDDVADPTRAGLIHGRLGYCLWVAGRNEDARAEHLEAIRLVPTDPPSAARARVLVGYSGWLMGAGRYGESAVIAREALEAAAATGALAEEGRARSNLGQDLVSLGDTEAGIAELEAARRIGQEVGPLDTLIVASANLSYHLIVADRFDDAFATATDGLETAREHGLERRFGPHFQAAAIDALFRAGRWDEAMVFVATVTKGRVGAIGAVYRDAATARLIGARGERTQARATIDQLTAIATEDIDADVEAFVRLVDAELAIEEERPERATTAVAAGLARLAEGDDTVLVGPLCAIGLRAAADRAERARALRRPADIEAAEADGTVLRERVDDLWAAAPPTVASARGYQAQCVAESGRLDGSSDPMAWRAAGARWADVGIPQLLAYARYREAEAWLIRGSRDDAEAALGEAVAVARGLGAVGLLASLDGLARRARMTVATAVAPADDDATAAPGRTGRDHNAAERRSGSFEARTGSAGAGRRRADERPDRPGAVHQPQDGQRPRDAHPRQARRLQPDRGGDDRCPGGDRGART